MTEIDTSAQSGGYLVGSASPGAATTFFAKYVFSATANNGQVTSAADSRTGKTATYGYDLLKRLTLATTGSWSQTYSFDGFGNLATKSVPTGSAEPAFPGANPDKNWLNGAVYDANGNTLGLNGLGFLYDTENRMSAFATGSFYENYVYDESNHRVERSNNAGGANADLVYFYGPGGKLMGTFQITLIAGSTRYTATVQNQRVYFGGMLLGQTGTDYSHDTSTLTDRLGTAAPGYPYGTDIGTAAGADQPDFATYTKEGGSGLEYANQRYYSAGYGRFMTVDPYGGSASVGTPASFNRYSYGSADPVGSIDPSGRGSCGLYMLTFDIGDFPTDISYEIDGDCGASDQLVLTVAAPGNRGMATNFGQALYAWQTAQSRVENLNDNAKCDDALGLINGLTFETLQLAVQTVSFQNGLTSATSMASLFAGSPTPSEVRGTVIKLGTTTVSQFLTGKDDANTPAAAVACLGCSNVYLDYKNVSISDIYGNMANVLHEALHNVTGLTDQELQGKLGLKSNVSSANISELLRQKCVR